MTARVELPDDLVLVRTTPVFDQDSVPQGLLAAHRVAVGVWGRLVVQSGALTFVFEDDPAEPLAVAADDSVAIPPGRHHRLIINGPVEFVVEFHRPPGD